MTTFVNDPVTIIGVELRTTNADSAATIPPFWDEVSGSGILASIPGRLSEDTYALYSNFENAGQDNNGFYSLIIGAAVKSDTPVPDGMTLAVIPASVREVFSVRDNDRHNVVEAWQEVWARTDLAKTYLCEYELYAANGEITVNIGVR
ncbi:effector binding domain-containing protein [Lysinibacter sp. HNR]|uniref:GyrI-like domain-containing protein n=1 Tax=Lysinibacter sp. HNR TaxID=3031408 RepID=UPI00243520BA|nr:effector binding domain-containing protein [Lysinibacter sp. HNR]WGD36528.1 effector binding domain-containing protein [Lysinibacter sp. HNR]